MVQDVEKREPSCTAGRNVSKLVQPLWKTVQSSLKKLNTELSRCCYLVTQSCLTPVTSWTVARQAPLSMGFSRQAYWSGLPSPSPELPYDPAILLLGIYPNKTKPQTSKATCTPTFTAGLFQEPRNGKNLSVH